MYSNNRNPFDKSRLKPAMANQSGLGGNLDVFNAVAVSDKNEQKGKIEQMKRQATLVEFPKHLFIPEGASSLDLRRVASFAAGSVKDLLWRYIAPPGAVTRFISYGIFNDGDNAADYEFLPLVNGARVFPYHGDPMDNYKIALGLSPDLNNSSLIPCQLTLLPGQVLEWYVTNTSAVATVMGVRMVGYFDASEKMTSPRFGG